MSSEQSQPVERQPLTMTQERFLDADEPDSEGHHNFYYAGVWYALSQGDRKASARRYDDTPDVVSIQVLTPQRRTRTHIPYYDPFLAAVVRRLLDDAPTRRVSFLCRDGYREIDTHRLFTRQGAGWRIVGWFWDAPWRLIALMGFAVLCEVLGKLLSR
jgi:hypothetical protein